MTDDELVNKLTFFENSYAGVMLVFSCRARQNQWWNTEQMGSAASLARAKRKAATKAGGGDSHPSSLTVSADPSLMTTAENVPVGKEPFTSENVPKETVKPLGTNDGSTSCDADVKHHAENGGCSGENGLHLEKSLSEPELLTSKPTKEPSCDVACHFCGRPWPASNRDVPTYTGDSQPSPAVSIHPSPMTAAENVPVGKGPLPLEDVPEETVESLGANDGSTSVDADVKQHAENGGCSGENGLHPEKSLSEPELLMSKPTKEPSCTVACHFCGKHKSNPEVPTYTGDSRPSSAVSVDPSHMTAAENVPVGKGPFPLEYVPEETVKSLGTNDGSTSDNADVKQHAENGGCSGEKGLHPEKYLSEPELLTSKPTKEPSCTVACHFCGKHKSDPDVPTYTGDSRPSPAVSVDPSHMTAAENVPVGKRPFPLEYVPEETVESLVTSDGSTSDNTDVKQHAENGECSGENGLHPEKSLSEPELLTSKLIKEPWCDLAGQFCGIDHSSPKPKCNPDLSTSTSTQLPICSCQLPPSGCEKVSCPFDDRKPVAVTEIQQEFGNFSGDIKDPPVDSTEKAGVITDSIQQKHLPPTDGAFSTDPEGHSSVAKFKSACMPAGTADDTKPTAAAAVDMCDVCVCEGPGPKTITVRYDENVGGRNDLPPVD